MSLRTLLNCLLFLLPVLPGCSSHKYNYSNWEMYRGGPESNCYSSLTQVNLQNVSQLEIAWTYHTNDKGPAIQCNPIVINGVMYVTSPALKVIALNAATGKMIWTFDPFKEGKPSGVNRGVTYFKEDKNNQLFFTAGYKLYAVSAATGILNEAFGDHGTVDLRLGLDRNTEQISIDVTSPGMVFGDLIILGSHVSESEGAAPGHVRAYDVHTGKQVWIFHTIPQPGEYGYDGWEKDAWKKIGGANTWSGFSLDEKRGWVFFATGSCAPDFYGGDRLGQNLFANSVVALDAVTGKRIWHYQVVHHDLWDYDLPATPNLVTVNHNGKQTDAVAQSTKTGNIFLLDRETGTPLFGVEERKVPASEIADEKSWPTQPFPVKPHAFVRQKYTEADVTDISPGAHAFALEQFKKARNEGIFTPAGPGGTMVFPGMRGGAEWNGASVDIKSGILYINANEIPNITSLKKIEAFDNEDMEMSAGRNLFQGNCATCHGLDRKGQRPFPSLIHIGDKLTAQDIRERITNGKGQMPAFPNLSTEQLNAVIKYLFNADKPAQVTTLRKVAVGSINEKPKYAHSGYGQFLDAEGYPAVKPPWGTLNAIDLNSGEILWKVPLGEYAALTKRGIPVTGTQNIGGTIVTAGGLIFVGATKDEKFRAINKDNGKIVWETTLPAGGYATPSTYEVNGKQYIVIAAGGAGKNDTRPGDAYVAFALP
jgi:quinoprotein glucose dehydrogenase